MADTFRALCAELVDIITAHANPDDYAVGDIAEMLARARAALAKADEPAVPEGREPAAVITEPSDEEGPSVEEVEELCEEHCFNVEGYESIECLQGLINEAIARWGNLKASLTSSPPADGEAAGCAAELLQRQVPVSVSERPWEREGWCDADGRCWWGRGESDDWSADWTLATPEAVAEFCEFSPQTVCLPAHALPRPEVNNG